MRPGAAGRQGIWGRTQMVTMARSWTGSAGSYLMRRYREGGQTLTGHTQRQRGANDRWPASAVGEPLLTIRRPSITCIVCNIFAQARYTKDGHSPHVHKRGRISSGTKRERERERGQLAAAAALFYAVGECRARLLQTTCALCRALLRPPPTLCDARGTFARYSSGRALFRSQL